MELRDVGSLSKTNRSCARVSEKSKCVRRLGGSLLPLAFTLTQRNFIIL